MATRQSFDEKSQITSLTSGSIPISLDLDAVTVHRFIGSRLSLHGR